MIPPGATNFLVLNVGKGMVQFPPIPLENDNPTPSNLSNPSIPKGETQHQSKEILPFKYLCWFCCGTRLPRDLIFVDDAVTEAGSGKLPLESNNAAQFGPTLWETYKQIG